MWLKISALLSLLSVLLLLPGVHSFSRRVPITCKTGLAVAQAAAADDIFGAEFSGVETEQGLRVTTIKPSEQKRLAEEADLQAKIIKSKAAYEKLRSSFLSDSIFISAIGLSIVWSFGEFKDAYSFGIGAALGILYSVLLGNYVERIGTSQESSLRDGLRFAPILILVALYSKYKIYLNIIMQLLGYLSSYQFASLLQAFNENAYGELDDIGNDKEVKS